MPKFKRHIFVCCNQRPPDHPRGSCDPTQENSLQKLFKKKLAAAGIGAEVRANKAGCLDQCEHGPTVVVYPEAIWYGFVSEADVDEIVSSHVVNGRPVERLVLDEACLNTARCPHKSRQT